MLENDSQLEDLFNKLSNDEIPLSFSEIDKLHIIFYQKKKFLLYN